MARWVFLFVFCVSARALVAVDIPLPATLSRLDSLNFVLPMANGELSADLHFGYDAKGRIVCSGDCNVDGSPVMIKGAIKVIGSGAAYKLALKGITDKVNMQFAGALAGGSAAFKYVGPKGKASGINQVVLDTEENPEASLSLSPVLDPKGKITGTGAIVSGFGNDSSTPGTLKGKLKGDSLLLNVTSGGQKLSFKGTRSGDGFLGTLKFKLPPAKGVLTNFFLPNLFAPPPPPPPVSATYGVSDDTGGEAGTLLVSNDLIVCTLHINDQFFFGRDERGTKLTRPSEEGFWLHLDLVDSALVNMGGIVFTVENRGHEIFSGFWTE